MQNQDVPKPAKPRKRRKPRKSRKSRNVAQAGYSAKNRDKIAASGAPQRDHVALSVLYVAMQKWRQRCPVSDEIMARALDYLESDGYDREATWARMKVMARQPRRKLTPPKKRE